MPEGIKNTSRIGGRNLESYSVQAILSATDRSFSSTMGSAAKSMDKIEGASNKATSSIMKIAAGVGVFKALSAGASMVRGSIDKAFGRIDTMEQFNRTMTVMLGSSEAAGKALDQVGTIVKGTAYGLDTAAKSTQGFVTAGLKIDKSTAAVEDWGNAVAFYGDGSNATFGNVTAQLSKMATKGTVSLEYLNTAIDAGIPVLDIYAKAVGKSTEEVAKEISSGSIKTEEFLDTMNKAFNEGVDGFPKIANAAKEAGASWRGTFDNMSAAVTRGTMGIINSMEKLLEDGGFPSLREMIKQVGVQAEASLGGVADLISNIDLNALIPSALGFAGALATVGGATPFIELVPDLYGAIQSKGSGLINDTKNLANAFQSDLGNGVKSLKDNIGKLPSMLEGAGNGIKGFANDAARTFTNLNISSAADMLNMESSVGSMVDKVLGKSKGLGNMFSSAQSAIGNFQQNVPLVADIFSGMGKSAGLMTDGISQAASVGTSVIGGFLGTIGNLMMMALKMITPAAIIGVVLVGLGMAVEQFGDEINGMINMALTKGPEVITKFVEGATSKIPELITLGSNLIGTLATTIQVLLPQIVTAGLDVIESLVQGIGNNSASLIRSALVIISTLLEVIITGLPRLISMGMDLILSLVQGIVQNIPLIVSTVTNLLTTFVETIVSSLPQILQTGFQILMELISGISQLIPQLIPVAVQMIVTLIEGLVSMMPMIISMAMELVTTLSQTLMDNLPMILTAGIQILTALIQGIVEILPQLIQMGFEIIGLLAGSLIEMLPDILSAGWEIIKALATGIIEAVPAVLTAAWDGIKSGFSSLWKSITGKAKESSDEMVSDVNTSNAQLESSYNSSGTNVVSSTNAMQQGITANSTLATQNAGSLAMQAYGDVTTQYGNMSTQVGNTTSQMATTVGNNSQNASNLSINSSAQAMSNVTKNFSSMNTNVSSQTSSMNSNIGSNLTSMGNTANNATKNMANNVNSNTSNMGSKSVADVNKMNSEVSNSMRQMENNTKGTMDSMNNSLSSGFSKSVSTSQRAMSDMSTATNNGVRSMDNSFSNSNMPSIAGVIARNTTGTMDGLSRDLDWAGFNAGIGLGNGLNSSSGYIYSVANNIAYNVASTIQRALDIHSPSRLTDWMGQMLGEGLVGGMLSMVGKLEKASEVFAGASVPEIDNNLGFDAIINRTVNTRINDQESVRDTKAKQPLELIFNLPSGKLRAFIDDITDIQQRDIELEDLYNV